MKKKLVVGMLNTGQAGLEERLFLEIAERKGVQLVMINLSKRFNEKEFETEVALCDFIYNNAGEQFVLEPLKAIEEYGKKVIDGSKLYYYTEDKWMCYVKCREYGIPTPKTVLLPSNLSLAKAELREFGQWPVILKRIYGMEGKFVEKAENLNDALAIMKSIWAKDIDKLPFVAQEYVKSYAYRVTMIGGKIVQAVIKKSRHWKCTGVYSGDCEKFRVDKKLRALLAKVYRATRINICGIDLLKRGKEWVVLEVNTEPGLVFIRAEYEKMIGHILDFILKTARKQKALKIKKNARTKIAKSRLKAIR